MTTAMTIASGNTGVSKVSGGEILAKAKEIEDLGRHIAQSGVCGDKVNPAGGTIIAWTCLTEGITPIEFGRKYHVIDGKPSMRADAMLAEFRTRGGKHKWIKDGSDGVAMLELSYDGQTITFPFAIVDAEQAGLIKEKSGWKKSPAAMLRARCVSGGIRMLAPEIVAGIFTPEEVEEFAADRQSPPAARKAAKGDAEMTKTATNETVIDAVATKVEEPVSQPTATAPEAEPAAKPPENFQLSAAMLAIHQIVTDKLKLTLEQFDATYKQKYGDKWPGLEKLTEDQAQKFAARLAAETEKN